MNRLIAAVTVLALVGPSCGDDKPPTFESVLKDRSGGPKKAAEVVIRSEKEWKAFVETCTSKDVRTKLGEAKVDFDKEIIVAVAIGRNSSELTEGEHKQAGVQKVSTDGDKSVVEYCVVISDVRTEEPLYPLHVIKMPKAKDVAFKKTEKTLGG